MFVAPDFLLSCNFKAGSIDGSITETEQLCGNPHKKDRNKELRKDSGGLGWGHLSLNTYYLSLCQIVYHGMT